MHICKAYSLHLEKDSNSKKIEFLLWSGCAGKARSFKLLQSHFKAKHPQHVLPPEEVYFLQEIRFEDTLFKNTFDIVSKNLRFESMTQEKTVSLDREKTSIAEKSSEEMDEVFFSLKLLYFLDTSLEFLFTRSPEYLNLIYRAWK